MLLPLPAIAVPVHDRCYFELVFSTCKCPFVKARAFAKHPGGSSFFCCCCTWYARFPAFLGLAALARLGFLFACLKPTVRQGWRNEN